MHKSQGMSLHFLEVDLSTVFEAGQAYVAVSRAMTIEGLMIVACKERLPQVCQLVVNFYSYGILMASELNVDEVLQDEKKRELTTLPMINAHECAHVPSTAKQPQIFVINEKFSSCELPEGAMDSVHRQVQKESDFSDDISVLLNKLKLKENDQKQIYSDSDIHMNSFCKWLWCVYMQIHHTNQSVTLTDRKKWTGLTKHLYCNCCYCYCYYCHCHCYLFPFVLLFCVVVFAVHLVLR